MNSRDTNSADSRKDPSTLEKEAAQVRNRLGHNIEELGDRLSPGDLVDQALGFAGEHGGEFGRNLGRQMKNNPLPLLLTGIGMTWLLASSNRPPQPRYESDYDYDPDYAYDTDPSYPYSARTGQRHRVGTTAYTDGADDGDSLGDKADQAKQTAKSKLGDAKSKIGDARDKLSSSAQSAKAKIKGKAGAAGSTMSDQADAAGSAMGDARHAVQAKGRDAYYATRSGARGAYAATRSGAETVSDTFTRMLEEQPLAVGALGVALGAALGGLLPRTRQEDEFMGDTRDQLVEKGKSMAADTYEDARDNVEQKARDVESALKEDGKSGSPRSGASGNNAGRSGSSRTGSSASAGSS